MSSWKEFLLEDGDAGDDDDDDDEGSEFAASEEASEAPPPPPQSPQPSPPPTPSPAPAPAPPPKQARAPEYLEFLNSIDVPDFEPPSSAGRALSSLLWDEEGEGDPDFDADGLLAESSSSEDEDEDDGGNSDDAADNTAPALRDLLCDAQYEIRYMAARAQLFGADEGDAAVPRAAFAGLVRALRVHAQIVHQQVSRSAAGTTYRANALARWEELRKERAEAAYDDPLYQVHLLDHDVASAKKAELRRCPSDRSPRHGITNEHVYMATDGAPFSRIAVCPAERALFFGGLAVYGYGNFRWVRKRCMPFLRDNRKSETAEELILRNIRGTACECGRMPPLRTFVPPECVPCGFRALERSWTEPLSSRETQVLLDNMQRHGRQQAFVRTSRQLGDRDPRALERLYEERKRGARDGVISAEDAEMISRLAAARAAERNEGDGDEDDDDDDDDEDWGAGDAAETPPPERAKKRTRKRKAAEAAELALLTQGTGRVKRRG